MTFEPNLGGAADERPPLAPPKGAPAGWRAVFWNVRELRAGWRLLMFLAITLLIAAVETGFLIALRVPTLKYRDSSAPSLLTTEGLELIAALGAGAIMALLEGRPFGAYGLPRAEMFRAHFWQGAVWGIGMITATILLIGILGGYSFGGFALRGAAVWGYAVLWGTVFLCVGFFEEFLFRGYAQYTLASGTGFWVAATLLSATFGAVHLTNGGEDKTGAFSVFAIAMFFCLTLRRTGNLWFAVGLHAAFDWGETFLYSVPDSGIVAPGHLLNSSFHGPAWLTGGTVGPEGSVMMFVVIGWAAVLFILVYPPDARGRLAPHDLRGSQENYASHHLRR